jgi:hypothetical protein
MCGFYGAYMPVFAGFLPRIWRKKAILALVPSLALRVFARKKTRKTREPGMPGSRTTSLLYYPWDIPLFVFNIVNAQLYPLAVFFCVKQSYKVVTQLYIYPLVGLGHSGSGTQNIQALSHKSDNNLALGHASCTSQQLGLSNICCALLPLVHNTCKQ